MVKIMASDRKIAANRTNAKKSTGPRSAQGKSRAKRNALKHGLTTVTRRNPAVLANIQRMATAIGGNVATPMQYKRALDIAESEVVLLAVRAARLDAIKRINTAVPTRRELMDPGHAAPHNTLAEMARYDRYERRAISRRERAIRTFVATSILGEDRV
jgi:hypothetical protein